MKKRAKKGLQATPLDKRRRQGSKLRSPFHQLGDKVAWSSWKDDHLPDVIWLAIICAVRDQKERIEIFRQIAEAARKEFLGENHASLTHYFLSKITFDSFRAILAPAIAHDDIKESLKILAAIDAMPDRRHWRELFGDVTAKDEDWQTLAKGVASCLDHQSQESTDIRWLKIIYLLAIEKMVVPEPMAERFLQYPYVGNMRQVRPMIRAAEMSTRSMFKEEADERATMECEPFWAEMLACTRCMTKSDDSETEEDDDALKEDIYSTIVELYEHFFSSIQNTDVDARLDSSFGISFYSLSLCLEMASLPSRHLATGRVVLRTITELAITLSFLRTKDDEAIWMQHRQYGSGQTALAFLKSSAGEDVPSHIDLEKLEVLANEDVWFETRDIDLGSWSKMNLREMSIAAGRKDLYDRYYDWTSGFVHGHWGAIRDTTFTTCLNPLHRLHRVPQPMKPLPSVVTECCKVTNQSLEMLNALYPSFKRRITKHY